jgi:hypothetical protein
MRLPERIWARAPKYQAVSGRSHSDFCVKVPNPSESGRHPVHNLRPQYRKLMYVGVSYSDLVKIGVRLYCIIVIMGQPCILILHACISRRFVGEFKQILVLQQVGRGLRL